MSSLACPECGAHVRIINSRVDVDRRSVRRRYKCSADHRFTTIEMQVEARSGVGTIRTVLNGLERGEELRTVAVELRALAKRVYPEESAA
jgi:transcriptional regulator NrdR family protein